MATAAFTPFTPALATPPPTTSGRSFARPLSLLLVLVVLLLTTILPAHARPLTEDDELPPTHVIADHVVISEIQVGMSDAADSEFVELYNPTASSIPLLGWRLSRWTSTASLTDPGAGTRTNLVPTFGDVQIPAYGYLLIAPPNDYGISISTDVFYDTTSRIAANNVIILFRDQGTEIVDMVGLGSANVREGSTVDSPSNGQSIERKAFYFSLDSDMSDQHANFGNGYDSGNNANDFILRTTPNPQSKISSSTLEPCCTTIAGTLTQQGRADHTGTAVLLWPGSGLRATTDSNGQFSIPDVPAIASEDTTQYSVEATFPGYLSVQTNLDLTSAPLPMTVTYSALKLLAGDLNGDNQVNIFDLTIVGSQYSNIGVFPGDVNGDGQVNIQDLSLVSGNFGRSTSQYIWLP